jgi:putative oxidoreductase
MSVGLLIIRLAIGLTLAAHGAQKLFGWFGGAGLDGTGAFFETIGFRPGRRYAAVTGLAEIAGGLGLAAGFATPVAAAATSAVMVGAINAVHRPNGFFNQDGGYEYPLLLGLVAVGVAFTGPGQASLDHAFGWQLAGTEWGLVAMAAGIAAAAVPFGLRAWRAGQHPGHAAPQAT